MKGPLIIKKLIASSAVFIACNLTLQVYCQNLRVHFENITSKEGLPERRINAIIQDTRGFIWIGSGEGLTRYDGYSCKVYRHEINNSQSISDNAIHALCIDGEGTLWIGSRNGLNRYDAQNDRFENFFHDSSSGNSLSHNEIFALARDTAGNLWVGTYGGGLDMMIKKKNSTGHKNYQFIHHKHTESDNSISNNQVFSLCFDTQGWAWVGTSKGLNVLQPVTKKFRHLFHQPGNKNSISSNAVYKIFAEKDGGVWICGKGMLDNIRRDNVLQDSLYVQHFLPAISGDENLNDWVINDFITDGHGNAWLATNTQGLLKFNVTKQGKVTSLEQFLSDWQIPYTIQSSNVICFFEDRSGIIWIGTGTGVSKYIPSKERFNEVTLSDKTFPSEIRMVMALLSDKQNRLWLVYDSDTLLVINRKSVHSSSIQTIALPESADGVDQVDVLYQSVAGDIYIGTFLQGLFMIPKSLQDIHDTKKWVRIAMDQYPALPSNKIFSIAENADGMILIGTYLGLSIYNPANRKMEPVYVSPGGNVVSEYIIRSVCVDRKGTTWCGTDKGVYLIKNGSVIKSFKNIAKDSASLSQDRITVCYVDHNRDIWVGTREGLNFYDPLHDNFKRFTTQNGLSNDCIWSIKEDSKGNLWIATNHGLSKFDTYRKKFYTYDTEDGLNSGQFNMNVACSDTSGIFYFGTNKGLVSFKPVNITLNEFVPPVVITNIKLFNTPLSFIGDTGLINTYKRENKLVLKYNQNFFSFDFAALNYINSAANQYAYKLEGIDRDWNNSGTQRFAGYTDISPGKYVFKVKASNNDGVWNNVPATVDVIIIPPWWKTWWFYTLCSIAVCGVIYLIYRIRLQQILKMYKLRSIISKDLHDDVGSALSSIALLSSIVQDGKTNARLKPEEIFSRIGDTSKRMIDLMDDIVWTVNPANDKFANMLIRMREYAVEMLEAKNISFNFKISEDVDDLKIPMQMRKHYFLIFKEAVNNLAKYSACSTASIVIERINRTIVTTVTDDGKGFNPQTIHSGNGLKNMQERANSMKSKFHIETAPGKGTRIILIIPVT